MTQGFGTARDTDEPPRQPAGWDQPNAMNSGSPVEATWTSTNAAEAVSGVQTPLGCSLFLDPGELSLRGAFHTIGALSKAESGVPESDGERAIEFPPGAVLATGGYAPQLGGPDPRRQREGPAVDCRVPHPSRLPWPNEGDVSATVWQEDAGPVERLIATYRDMPGSTAPGGSTTRPRPAAGGCQGRVSRCAATLGPVSRPRRHPHRKPVPPNARRRQGGAIAGARRSPRGSPPAGRNLRRSGVLDQPEDVFMLRFDELARGRPVAARQRVSQRRPLYDFYRTLDIPALWWGAPRPEQTKSDGDTAAHDGPARIEGTAPAQAPWRARYGWSPTQRSPTSRPARSSWPGTPTRRGHR